MTLRDHIAYSGICSLVLYPFVGIGNVLSFFLGGILIDLDHCIEYAMKFRCFSVRGMFAFYDELFSGRESSAYLGLSVFHTTEFLFFIFILSLFFPWLWFAWAGMVMHWFLDLICLYNPRATRYRALSLIEYFLSIKYFREANRELEAGILRQHSGRKECFHAPGDKAVDSGVPVDTGKERV